VTILFDFGGTLDADGTRWSVRFHEAYRRAGGRLGLERFEPLFRESDRQLAHLRGIRRAGFLATLEAQSALLTQLLGDEGEVLEPSLLTEPVYRSALAIVARNRLTLSRLAGDHQLGIVSNFTGNLDVCLAELELASLFDVVIDSTNAGFAKPDPRIFQLALLALDSEPSATWMVGDNPDADLRPAAVLGIKTCWLAAPEDHRPLPPGLPTARIERLSDLAGVLEPSCTV
jgi:FMN phosphatase YigB (HAD superfamily)